MGRPSISIEIFKQRIKERFPTEIFTILSYKTIGEPLEIKCEDCGQIIKVSKANNFLAKNKVWGCMYCKGLHLKREEKINELLQKYLIISDSEIKGTHRIYVLKCKTCGHIRKTYFSNFIKNPQCGCETGVYRRTKEEFNQDFLKKTNNEYVLEEDFRGMLKKISIKHLSCGFVFKIRPSDLFYNGTGKCPKCYQKESANCTFITSLLEKIPVHFEKEVRVGETRQFFDFFLKDYKIAIEYNGEQHYSFNSKFHRCQEDFELQIERDNRKKEYCKNNNLKLIVIPYYKTREEIQNIIESLVSESSTTKVEEVLEKSVLP